MKTVAEDQLVAAYGLLYVRRGAAVDPFLTEVGQYRHFDLGNGAGTILTQKRDGTVDVRVEVLDEPPSGTLSAWDHVVEASLDGDGDLSVSSWDGEPSITVAVPAAALRLRCHWGGLEKRGTGTRADAPGSEHLLLQVWPAELAPPAVLVTWADWPIPDLGPRAAHGRLEVRGQAEIDRRLEGAHGFRVLDYNGAPLPGYDRASSACYRLYADRDDVDLWWVYGLVNEPPTAVSVAVAIDRATAMEWLERCHRSTYGRDGTGALYYCTSGRTPPAADLVQTMMAGGPAGVERRVAALVERGLTIDIAEIDVDPLPGDFWPTGT